MATATRNGTITLSADLLGAASRKTDGYFAPLSGAQIHAACQRYAQFLTLHARYPRAALVPATDIDEVWHLHILHTIAYAKDCARIFGRFLHHTPSSGSFAEQRRLGKNFAATAELWRTEFGTNYVPEKRRRKNVANLPHPPTNHSRRLNNQVQRKNRKAR